MKPSLQLKPRPAVSNDSSIAANEIRLLQLSTLDLQQEIKKHLNLTHYSMSKKAMKKRHHRKKKPNEVTKKKKQLKPHQSKDLPLART
ncbi:hypothetical protein OH492_03370 [Vibrio chagasii]|nr:hypothetical protein [Vibrio chagasii]